jgi:hypothetical protein
MNALAKFLASLKPKPRTGEDLEANLEAEAEAQRLQDRNLDVRLSQRSGSAGENYQSGRDSL